MSDSGYALSYRRLWKHPVFRNKQEASVFAWMKDIAQWQDARLSTKFGPVQLARGELLIAERGLAEDFGMHRNTFRALIQRMVDDGMIELIRDRCTHRAGTVVRICNYDRYQTLGAEQDEAQDRSETVNETEAGPKEDRSRTKNKESNTGKEGKLESPPSPPPTDLLGEPPESQRPKRPTRLPSDWTLPDEYRRWAIDAARGPPGSPPPNFDVETFVTYQGNQFANYWPAVGKTRVDWLATWRQWIGKHLEEKRTHGNGNRKPQRVTPSDAESARDRAILESVGFDLEPGGPGAG